MLGGGAAGTGGSVGGQKPRRYPIRKGKVADRSTFSWGAHTGHAHPPKPHPNAGMGNHATTFSKVYGGSKRPSRRKHSGASASYYEAQAGGGFRSVGKRRRSQKRTRTRERQRVVAPAKTKVIG